MLQVKQVANVPEGLALTDYSAAEFNSSAADEVLNLVQKSPHVWTLENDEEIIMVVGVYAPSFVGPAELWMLTCRSFSRNLRHNLEEVREKVSELLSLYPNVRVRVDSKFPAGRRFAEFMGFREISRTSWKDREYVLYEVK